MGHNGAYGGGKLSVPDDYTNADGEDEFRVVFGVAVNFSCAWEVLFDGFEVVTGAVETWGCSLVYRFMNCNLEK